MPQRFLAVFQALARLIFVPAIAIVVWGELEPGGTGPRVWDKLLHFTAYFGLAGIATVALGSLRGALWAGLSLAIFGGVLEIVQSFVGRDAEWGDEIANVIGVCAGVASGLILLSVLRLLFFRQRLSEGENGHGPVR